ncbi:MAG: hypothetical protein IBX55_01485 [Methyloprofundus sp.]|nr:hypothetical protein [Methyloprofundus sp.]
MATPSRTKSTEDQYLKKFELLRERFISETNFDPYSEMDEFAEWLDILRKTLKKSSWRIYRSAINQAIIKEKQTEKLVSVLSRVGEGNPGCRVSKKTSRTSAKKSKTVTNSELSELIEFLKKENTSTSILTMRFILSTRYCGLRPVEWRTCDIDMVEKKLHVKNAKSTNGRANGEYRLLDLSSIPSEVLNHINILVSDLGWSEVERFERAYVKVKNKLYQAGKKLFPYRRGGTITLYTFRHQYLADMKKSLEDVYGVSASAGHASIETAQLHYSKRRNGRINSELALPSEEDIERLKNSSKTEKIINRREEKKLRFT